MQTKISIVIAVYNAEAFLSRCIDSVLSQSLCDFEVIAVNDCSSDGSLEILQTYVLKDCRVRVFADDNNLGAGPTRNLAISKSKGEYIFILDADDYLKDKYVLERLYSSAKEDNSDIVLFDFEICNEVSKQSRSRQNSYVSGKQKIVPDKCLLMSWCRLYRREFLESHHIRFGIGNHGEDHLFSLKSLYETEKISYLPKTCYVYTERAGSITNNLHISEQDHLQSCNDSALALEHSSFESADEQILTNLNSVETYLKSRADFESLKSGFERYRLKTLKAHYSTIPVALQENFLQKVEQLLPGKDFARFKHSLSPSVFEWLFSIKNIKDHESLIKHKVLTVCGRQFVLNPADESKSALCPKYYNKKED